MIDSLTREPVELATVSATLKIDGLLLGFTQTDSVGNFTVVLPASGSRRLVMLKVQSLGYGEYLQELLILRDGSELVRLPIALQKASSTLRTVEVTAKKPIIVKGDTIIYDIAAFQSTHHATLEDILSDMPGFEVAADGSITVNRRSVDRVVIDGEEVSNEGAALITRSLAAGTVASVEVRMNEQDTKLKNSLLSEQRIITLDIKLSDDLKKSFFGYLEPTIGSGREVAAGGYVNTFSLREKFKLHGFVERDNFGLPNIDLTSIKNLGTEEYGNLISTPTSYQALTQRKAYQIETYGLDNFFVRNEHLIAGLTARYAGSSVLDIQFGSYTGINQLATSSNVFQRYIDGNRFDLASGESSERLFTKNKLRLDYNTSSWKLNAEAIYQYREPEVATDHRIDNREYSFRANEQASNWTFRLFGERKLGPKSGLHLQLDQQIGAGDAAYRLTTFDTAHLAFLGAEKSAQDNQSIEYTNRTSTLRHKANIFYQQRVGSRSSVKLGGALSDRFEKFNQLSVDSLTAFDGQRIKNRSFNFHPYVSLNRRLGRAGLEMKFGPVFYGLASTAVQDVYSSNWLFSGSFNYTPGNYDHIILTVDRELSDYPIEFLRGVRSLVDFQTVNLPGRNLPNPPLRDLVELLLGKYLEGSRLMLDLFAVYARNRDQDRVATNLDLGISRAYDQLLDYYHAYGVAIEKTFLGSNFKLRLEPEAIFSSTRNRFNENGYTNNVSDYRLGLRGSLTAPARAYTFDALVKYSAVRYVLADITSQRQDLVQLSLMQRIRDKKARLSARLRTRLVGVLTDDGPINFLIDGGVKYHTGSLIFECQVMNLLDAATFVRVQQLAVVRTTSEDALFSRFARFGIRYRFGQ